MGKLTSPPLPDVGRQNMARATVPPRSVPRLAARVVIPAKAGWIGTNIEVKARESLAFEAVGKWSHGSEGPTNRRPQYGPEGYGKTDPYALFPRARIGSLIGRIGAGRPFLVGEGCAFISRTAGRLHFAMNDTDPSNNTGQTVATIRVFSAKPPPFTRFALRANIRRAQVDRAFSAVNKLLSECWLGPVDDSLADPDGRPTPDSIREFWNARGCVRCFLAAYANCLPSGKWHPRVDNNFTLLNPDVIPLVENAWEHWRNPASRRRDRFYCERCTVRLPCGVALHSQSGSSGHVGWAYGVPPVWRNEDLYQFPSGTKETNPHGCWRVGEKALGAIVLPAGREVSTDDPRIFFSAYGYTWWKQMWADDANFEEAFLLALQSLRMNYMIIVNNCNIAAHGVMLAFGGKGAPRGRTFWKDRYIAADYFSLVDAPAERIRD